MYETGNQPTGMGKMEECQPNFEEMASNLKKRIGVYRRFETSLTEFIHTIGRHSFKREGGTLPELVGIVALDLIDMDGEYENLLSKLESSGS